MENNIKTNTDKYILNTYKRQDLVIDKGNDVYLYDINGKKYLDFVSGIGVNSLGAVFCIFCFCTYFLYDIFNPVKNVFYG